MYNQKDIVLIPIPFTDLTSQKKRPVIIISNNDYNNSQDIVVVALTSNITYSDEYSIIIDNTNLEQGTLPKKSKIRCDKIYTLAKDIVVKKFSTINNQTFANIKEKVNLLINKK